MDPDERDFRPLPIDHGNPLALSAMADITDQHFWAYDHTSFGAIAFKADGTDPQHVVILELTGRRNKSTEDVSAKVILSLDNAVALFEVFGHTLQQMLAERG